MNFSVFLVFYKLANCTVTLVFQIFLIGLKRIWNRPQRHPELSEVKGTAAKERPESAASMGEVRTGLFWFGFWVFFGWWGLWGFFWVF